MTTSFLLIFLAFEAFEKKKKNLGLEALILNAGRKKKKIGSHNIYGHLQQTILCGCCYPPN